jgi:hypothetical protein
LLSPQATSAQNSQKSVHTHIHYIEATSLLTFDNFWQLSAAGQVRPEDFGQTSQKCFLLYRKYTQLQPLTLRNFCQVHDSLGAGKTASTIAVGGNDTVSQSVQLRRPDTYTLTVRILSGLGRACNKIKK